VRNYERYTMSDKSPDELPTHLIQTFKSLQRLYDSKQYRRCLRATDVILREYPYHGKTLSMKGLTLNTLKRKKEAYTCVRKALRYNIKNHTCWHVMGLLHRTDRNYMDAAKCFEVALLYHKDNTQILRDLSSMHMQNRNWVENLKLRHKLLMDKPSDQQNWLAYAMSLHLVQDYDKSLNVLDAYVSAQKPKDDKEKEKEKYKQSELKLYKNMIIEESGNLQVALDHLEEIKTQVTDKEDWKIKRAHYLSKLGRLEESAEQWKVLIHENPENVLYHEGLLKTLHYIPHQGSLWDSYKLDQTQTTHVVDLYTTLITENPQGKVCKQAVLSFVHGKEFKERLKVFFLSSFY